MLWAGLGRRRERGREARRRIETVGMVVHDLRGPLTGIGLAAERLRRDCPPPVRERACAAIDRECGRLGGIVDDLLTLCAERAATSPECAPHSLVDVLDDVAERLRTREGCTVVVDADPSLRATPADGQLTRAVGNIAENAARHAAERVRICARQSADGLEIVIDDDGEGFAPGFAPAAFRRGAAGGSAGLGLTSARQAVERLGGSLRLGRRAGGGAAISLRVPLRGVPR
jgi:signal transduction histidine kinase